MAQEALEALKLEKRLSLLSHVVRPGSGGRWAAPAAGKGSASGLLFVPSLCSFVHSFLLLCSLICSLLVMPHTPPASLGPEQRRGAA